MNRREISTVEEAGFFAPLFCCLRILGRKKPVGDEPAGEAGGNFLARKYQAARTAFGSTIS
jgi:hypothetical protein